MWSVYSRAWLAEVVREEIIECLDLGATLEQVQEDLIGSAEELTDEERAALWLYAWSYCHSRAAAAQLRALIGVGDID